MIPETEGAQHQTVQLTLVTAQEPDVLSKSFSLREDGSLDKKPGGNLLKGQAQTLTITIHDFLAGLKSLTPGQAFVYGICAHERARIVLQTKLQAAKARSNTPVIARDREHFSYPAAGAVLTLDYDPSPNMPTLNREELLTKLYLVWPALKDHPHIWIPSASSCIYRSDTGEELRGIKGQRVYVPVLEGTDIPRAGAALFKRLWLAGFGWFSVSNSGALLERSIVDAAFWQPERFDFAGGAACGPGLEQRKPDPVVYNLDKPFMDSRSIQDLIPEEQRKLDGIKAAARKAKKPETEEQREAWIAERLKGRPSDSGQLRRILEAAVKEKRLLSDFVLHSARYGKVSVGTILDNPEKYHGDRFADPLEPEYGNDQRIAWANLRSAGKPYIWSWAHGGQKFTLHRNIENIRIEGGDRPQIVSRLLELMRLDGSIFDRGGELVRLAGGRTYPVTTEWLQLYLGGLARFEKFDKRSDDWREIDCPKELAQAILSLSGLWDLPRLVAVITAPIATPRGRIIETDGYDEETGLYLDLGDFSGWKGVPEHPSDNVVRDAVDTLWYQVKDFPFKSPGDRGGCLAALLTATVRPALPTAPGTLIESPTAGSGKTLLARTTAQITGSDGEVMPKADTDEEMRKRLLALTRCNSPVIILDNISGAFASDTLCAFLTSEHITDRVLGSTTIISGRTNSMVILTGNNPQVQGDLNRRLVRVRIDPSCEKPFLRCFDFDPVEQVRSKRLDIVRSSLIILKASILSGFKHAGGRLASFEVWSDFIRNAVIWVGQRGWLDVEDPVQSIETSYSTDPETQRLDALLSVWLKQFDSKGGTVAEAIRWARGDEKRPYGNPELFSVLDDIAGERGVINPRRLGRWIEGRAGRIVAGRRFVRVGTRQGAVVWVCEFCEICESSLMPHGKCQNDIYIEGSVNSHKSHETHASFTPHEYMVICEACANFKPHPKDPTFQGHCNGTPPDADRLRFPNIKIDCPDFRGKEAGTVCQ